MPCRGRSRRRERGDRRERLGDRGAARTRSAGSPTAATNISYVLARSDGFVGGTLTARQGRVVQWSFMGSSSQNVTDSTGMGLFASGNRSPVGYYSFVVQRGGYLPVHRHAAPGVRGNGLGAMTAAPGPNGGHVHAHVGVRRASRQLRVRRPDESSRRDHVDRVGQRHHRDRTRPSPRRPVRASISSKRGCATPPTTQRRTGRRHSRCVAGTGRCSTTTTGTPAFPPIPRSAPPPPPASRCGGRPRSASGHAPVESSPAVAYNTTRAKTLVYAATTSGMIDADRPRHRRRRLGHLGIRRHLLRRRSWRPTPSISAPPSTRAPASTANSSPSTPPPANCNAASSPTDGSSPRPVVGQVDSTGPVVFFGDTGISETSNAGHEWAVNGVGNTAGACTQRWVFNAWNNSGTNHSSTGSWSPPALATDSTGRPARRHGQQPTRRLRLRARRPHRRKGVALPNRQIGDDTDVGAGPTISPPGIQRLRARRRLHRRQGLQRVRPRPPHRRKDLGVQPPSRTPAASPPKTNRSTAAFTLGRVIVPYAGYLFSLNPTTGAQSGDPPTAGHYFSSPVVSGAPGDRVILIGDDANIEHAYRLDDGTPLFAYTTGGPIYSSTAVASGTVLFGSNDGYLYALG